jgi:hypothetical protein
MKGRNDNICFYWWSRKEWPASSNDIMNDGAIFPLPPCVHIAWYLIKTTMLIVHRPSVYISLPWLLIIWKFTYSFLIRFQCFTCGERMRKKKLAFELTHVTKKLAIFPGMSLEKEYICIYICHIFSTTRRLRDRREIRYCRSSIWICISFRILLVFTLSSQINSVTYRGDYRRGLVCWIDLLIIYWS